MNTDDSISSHWNLIKHRLKTDLFSIMHVDLPKWFRITHKLAVCIIVYQNAPKFRAKYSSLFVIECFISNTMNTVSGNGLHPLFGFDFEGWIVSHCMKTFGAHGYDSIQYNTIQFNATSLVRSLCLSASSAKNLKIHSFCRLEHAEICDVCFQCEWVDAWMEYKSFYHSF